MPEYDPVRIDQEALALKRANMEKAGAEFVDPTTYVKNLFEKPISQ